MNEVVKDFCELCNRHHYENEEVDVYECYNNYLKRHPKNTEKEVWDIVKKKWIKVLTTLLILFIGCEDFGEESPELFLELSTPLQQVQEDTYSFKYPTNSPHSYVRVNIRSNPLNRVFFDTPDTFTIIHQGREIITPIINYSVYVRDDSTTRQFVYIYPPHIGKTLSILAIAEDRDGNQISDTIFLNID